MATETIPGGCYRSPDGSWHDANGESITPPPEVAAAQAEADGVDVAAPADVDEPEDEAAEPESAPVDLGSLSVDELEALLGDAVENIEGSGASGNVVKADLVAAARAAGLGS